MVAWGLIHVDFDLGLSIAVDLRCCARVLVQMHKEQHPLAVVMDAHKSAHIVLVATTAVLPKLSSLTESHFVS